VRWVSRLTTGAVILIIVAGLALLVRAKAPNAKVAGSFKTYVKFRDGARLASGSPVVIAGVQVGLITKLTVEGSLARIDMTLQDGLDLPVDSFATRRADSLFGDSYVEIVPWDGDAGAGKIQLLKSGEPITHVIEGGSTDALLRGIASALPRIDNALGVVHDGAINARTWVNGPFTARLTGIDTWLTEGHLEGPLASAERSVTRLDEVTTRSAEAVAGAVPEVASTLERINRAVVNARGKIGDLKYGIATALQDTRAGLDRVDPQIEQATELMAAINNAEGNDWKGTLGTLVNDRGLGETLDDVAQGGRDAVAGFNRFQSWLGMRIEYNVFSHAVRFYATAELHARNDKFYLIEIERGPLGAVPNDTLSDAVGTAAFTRYQEIKDKPRFTAEFGKHLGRFSLRGGIKDSTFGAGGDAVLFDGRLKLSTDLYGAFTATPRLKLYGALAVFRSVYVLAGVDDALNTPGYLPIVPGNPGAPRTFDSVRFGRDYFVGTTLSFTDADLSILLRVYGALLIGLLTG
jgi:phospholipid/cholesterol/gamma-HCH transport system substrate-binding protein